MTASPDSAQPVSKRKRLLPWLSVLDRPLASYHLIIGSTTLLLAIGLVMVLSTSSASQLYAGESPYSVFVKQLIGALIGLPIMWMLARTPPRILRALAYPALLTAIAGLILVFPFGESVDGGERWISVAGILIQPSEFAKLALLLWGADLLARKEKLGQLSDARTLLMPLLPGVAVLALLVMLGDDLGTTFMLLVILLTLLWVVGTPGRLFACLLGLILFALLILIIAKGYRDQRLTSFLNPSGGATGLNMQAIQGKWAIGSGEVFGVGLGKGTQKWGWVPNASNDFIFAILGEELGLIGTICVVFLYGGLAYAGLRVARRMADPFMRLAAAGITAWIVVQALVNICSVVGLLPITGVPLPLISQGLSSLLVTMAAIGVLLSFARREPGAAQALAAGAPARSARIMRSFRSGEQPATEPGPAVLRHSSHPYGPSRPSVRSRPSPGPVRLSGQPRQRTPAPPPSLGSRPAQRSTGRNSAGRDWAGRDRAGRDRAGRDRAGRNEV
jgi:cell division protein FtsW